MYGGWAGEGVRVGVGVGDIEDRELKLNLRLELGVWMGTGDAGLQWARWLHCWACHSSAGAVHRLDWRSAVIFEHCCAFGACGK